MSKSHHVIFPEIYFLTFCVTQVSQCTNRDNVHISSAHEELDPEECDVWILAMNIRILKGMNGGESLA